MITRGRSVLFLACLGLIGSGCGLLGTDETPEDTGDPDPTDTVDDPPTDETDTPTVDTDTDPTDPPTEGSYLRTTAVSVELDATGAPTELLSVDVPAGDWYVRGKATAVDFGANDYVRCVLQSDGAQLDASTTNLGNAAPGPSGETGPAAATLAVQALASLTGPATITLSCQHDFYQAGEYIDPGASLIVVPASGTGGAATGATNLPTYSGVPELVTSVSAAGDAVVLGKATVVNFGAADYARCTLDDGAFMDASATVIGSATPGFSGELGPAAATVAMQAVASHASATSYALACQHDYYGAGRYVDPGASLVVLAGAGAVNGASSAATFLGPYSSTPDPVATVSIGAGTWAVVAKATPVNFGDNDYARCTITGSDGQQLDASATQIGNGAPGYTGERGPSAATVTMQTLVETTGAETLTLSCQHDAPFAGQYVDPGASILAFPVAGPIL